MSDENNLIQTFEDWTEKSPDVMALRWLKNKVSELERELSEVKIKASAKAVIVPEGKGIFWTNKIEALEKDWDLHIQSESKIHDDQKEQFAKLQQKVANPEWLDVLILDLMKPHLNELKEQIPKLNKRITNEYNKLLWIHMIPYKEWFWNLKYSVDKQISKLKEEHDLDIYTLLQAINGWGKNHINLEVVLQKFKKTMKRFFTILPEEWEEWMDKTYFIERLEKQDGKKSVNCSECENEDNTARLSECSVGHHRGYGIHYKCDDFKQKDGVKPSICYHQWRYFNKWCQECSEFGHGIIVSHCFKCGEYWDRENGFWTQEDVNNLFFNEHFRTDGASNIKVTISRDEGEEDDISKDVISSEGKESSNPERRKEGSKVHSISNDPIIKKAQEKFQEIKDSKKLSNPKCPKCGKENESIPIGDSGIGYHIKEDFYCSYCGHHYFQAQREDKKCTECGTEIFPDAEQCSSECFEKFQWKKKAQREASHAEDKIHYVNDIIDSIPGLKLVETEDLKRWFDIMEEREYDEKYLEQVEHLRKDKEKYLLDNPTDSEEQDNVK